MRLAGCIVKNSAGKVLLVHRNTPARTQWEIPGGKIEKNETPSDAAIRELKEELGVVVDIVRHIGVKLFEQDGEQHEYHWFEGKITDGEPRIAEPYVHDDLRHFALDEMHKIHDALSANTKNFVTALSREEITL